MSDKGKNAADEAQTTMDTMKRIFTTHWKILIGVLVVAIVLFNTFWSMTENSITETVAREVRAFNVELQSLKSDLAGLDARFADMDTRLSEAEKGATDLDAIREDIAAIRNAGEHFEKRLLAVIKAEEIKLAELEQGVESQKAYVNELKSLLEGAVD